MVNPRMLVWSVHATSGFDTAWVTLHAGLQADGVAAGLQPVPYRLAYSLQTDADYVTQRLSVRARWDTGSAQLELRREDGRWTVDGEPRPDLDGALDCDLMACPLTNTMPLLRHALLAGPADVELTMAFIEVPRLGVVASMQRYTHLRTLDGGGALIRYRSGSFSSDITFDADGFVVDYPKLGRRAEPR